MATPWGDSPFPPLFPRPAGQRPRHPSFNPPNEHSSRRPPSHNTVPSSSDLHSNDLQFPQPSIPAGFAPSRPGPAPPMPVPMILRPGADSRSTPPVPHMRRASSYFFEPADEPPRSPSMVPSFPPQSPHIPNAEHVPAMPPKLPRPPRSDVSQPPPMPLQAPPPPRPAAQRSRHSGPQLVVVPPTGTNRDTPLSPGSEQDEVLKRVLAMSARESENRQQSQQQEEEDLARALAESLADTHLHSPSPSISSLEVVVPDSALLISSPVDMAHPSPGRPESNEATPSNAPISAPAPAKYLPPQYEEVVSSYFQPDTNRLHALPSLPSQVSLLSTSEESVSMAPSSWAGSNLIPPLGRCSSAQPAPSASLGALGMDNRRAQSFAGVSRPSQSISGSQAEHRPVMIQTSSGVSIQSSIVQPRLPFVKEKKSFASPSSAPPIVTEMTSPNQYVDKDLLRGVSLGFGPPAVSTSMAPFNGVLPNVVALPYGRCPPFHIRAPSWRMLLKLMARLSNTRLQPTVEAMAIVKTEMRLRVVVSFVKVHHSSPIWHTILYMTIDHPVPPNAPNAWKYKNGDTSTLPWSYTLSAKPPFLRDGSDASMSKFYTIPSTQTTPFPTLPISFPNLALYLASALEESRDAMHDGSGGLRRLAKAVDALYPDERIEDSASERSGMRQMFKSLVGMGHKPTRDRNAETYDLVTPFVADDYGG